MNIDFETGSQLLKAISDPTRICIVHILSCGELCVCEIQRYFNVSQPTLSHHLTILKNVGIITATRKGKWMYYGINREKVKLLTGFLDTVFLPGDECLCKMLDQEGASC
ncbi:metalloregulator ArsR/SmtB family transcription factor [uncultured Sphaerochaeta sp.]|uniref:ArsR/SmtB family transcription factor n=1 Tax=uncultured Sphaerochaeta sp. TaxID=886478 RepID=UPI0029CA41FF|nr:metalloregulator ArsR/SmtB family transcription factor [uncultured Sphaerochaeta sp.]